jgi:uncharacterized Zn-binding protein involved in type VI secretion
VITKIKCLNDVSSFRSNMKPAARVGDMTSHPGTFLTPIGPAPPSDVLIEGKPAWRATLDIHACPLFDGPKPHVGGTVSIGSITVRINNCSAVRVGDVINEPGFPNIIASGARFVFIGD